MKLFKKILALIICVLVLAVLFYWPHLQRRHLLKKRAAYVALVAGLPEEFGRCLAAGPAINDYIDIKNNGTRTTLLIQAIINNPDDIKARQMLRTIFSKTWLDVNKPEKLVHNNISSDGRRPINGVMFWLFSC